MKGLQRRILFFRKITRWVSPCDNGTYCIHVKSFIDGDKQTFLASIKL